MVIPLIMEQVFMAAIGMFDVIMVSGLGEHSISAVSLVDFINQLINSVLTALSTGGAIVCSQYLGRKNLKDAGEAVEHLILLTVLAGIVLMLAALAGNPWILTVIYGPIEPQVMDAGRIYFCLSGISYPFIALFCCCSAVMRALGYARLSFHTSLIMNLLNIFMNALFIFGFRWGVFGAGLASLLSRAVISLVLFYMILPGGHTPMDVPSKKGRFMPMGMKKQNMVPVRPLFQWRLKKRTISAVLGLAIPTSLESSLFYIGRLLVQRVVTGFGTSAIAANAVSLTVTEFLHMPGAGTGIAMITIVGRCIGADEKKQARGYAAGLIRLTYILQGVCCIASMALASPITGLYNLTAVTKETAVWMLMTHGIICTIFWPMGFTAANALKSAGDVKFTMVMSFACMWVFRVGGSYLFVKLFPRFGVMNVWFAMYCDWIARAAVCLVRYKGDKWLNKKVK